MKKMHWILAGSLLALGALGCGPRPDGAPVSGVPEGPVGDPVTGDWLVEHLGAEPAHLNPFLDTGDANVQMMAGGNIFQSLLTRDPETTEIIPLVAESWEIADDHLTYTFHLRRDATFSDGEPLTAHDVAFSYDLIMDPANDTASIRSYYTDVERVEVLDDYTVAIHCTQPYFRHLQTFGGASILPQHVYGEGDFNTHPNNRRPIGSGPYVFESWRTNQEIVLARREDYWHEKKPYLDKLVYKIITDDNAAFQVLQRQELDRMRLSPEHWVRRAATPQFEAMFDKHTLYSPIDGYLGRFGWIGWNLRRPQFEDARVRQALTMLLDRQTILDTVFHGLGRVVTGYDFPDTPEYDQSIEPWPYDPARARELLEEAGWVDTTGNGIRDKDGVQFAFTWSYPTGVPEYDRLATVYKEQLGRAGINVTLRPLEWATFLESVTNRNFDACMMSWVSPVDSDPYQIWHSSQIERGSNYVGFVNEESDRLIEEARVEFDAERRAELYRRFHRILHEEQPYTFLYNNPRLMVVDKRFQDVNPYMLGFDIHEWWVPEDRQRYGR